MAHPHEQEGLVLGVGTLRKSPRWLLEPLGPLSLRLGQGLLGRIVAVGQDRAPNDGYQAVSVFIGQVSANL